MANIWYIVARNSDGIARALFRFHKDENGSHEEELDAYGNWVQDNSLISVLRNLHNPAYAEISEEEAAKIAPLLGGTIELEENDITLTHG